MRHDAWCLVLSYAAVTPARDEEENLPRLARSLAAQTVPPEKWVIVENGSRDSTPEIARGLSERFDWIELVEMPGSGVYKRIVAERAFEVGLEVLAGAGDLVAKLDADVSFEPHYFEKVLEAFESEPGLGVASGTLLEHRAGEWRELPLLGSHCWGPTRTYRRACLECVLPLDGGVCFTWADETKARLSGFSSRTLRHLPFRHHRPEAMDESGLWTHWGAQGRGSYYLGYRPSYLLARCVYRASREPQAVALMVGYFGAALRREPRYGDQRIVEEIREQQRARHFLATLTRRTRSLDQPSSAGSW